MRFRFLVCLLALVSLLTGSGLAHAEARVALVMGNAAYQGATPLANPVNDARDMSAALKKAGFTVIEALDADKRQFDGALRAFADALSKADVALFFYAGHGLQVGTQNYLLPIDAKLERERDLEFEAVRLDFVQRQMEIDREGKTTIVILDACRDNPLARNLARSMGTRSASIGRGLAAAPAGLGTFIAYSTQPGNVALDGDGRNSPFSTALVKHMGVPGRNLPATMIEVRKDVVASTGGRQVPWDHSALTGDFYFSAAAAAQAPQGTIAAAPQGNGTDIAALQERLRKLEEQAKARDAAAAPPAQQKPATDTAKTAALPPVTPRPGTAKDNPNFEIAENVRLDGLMLGEQRQPSPVSCRDVCEQNRDCVAFQHGKRVGVMGMCRLFSRVDARHEDLNWRSGVRIAASPPEATAARASVPPKLDMGGPPTRRERGLDIYEGVTIVMGKQIKMSTAQSFNECNVICRHTPGCVAASYNEFFRGKNLACQVFEEVSSTMKAPTATTFVRRE
jgi:uncharacterized caspase-like protein